MVQSVTGLAFSHEAHSGYVNWREGVVIAPACAGINFMIIAFCLSAFTFLYRFKRLHYGLVWIAFSLLLAFMLTVAVNTLRIAAAIFLYSADIYSDWITPRQVHRLAGILIYLGALYAWHAALCRLFNPRRNRVPIRLLHLVRHNAIPVFWYGIIALAVPLANLAFQKNMLRFAEHVGIVSTVCLLLWAGISLVQLCYGKIQAKMESVSKRRAGNKPPISSIPAIGKIRGRHETENFDC
jgi:exosortase K